MKLINMYKNQSPVISFEIFPPKVTMPLDSIYESLERFKRMGPDYISVTYGAGGSQKDRTMEIASKIKNEFEIETMAHFTCVGHNREDIDSMLDALHENGLENILALRGDPPQNQPDFDFSRNVYNYASQLVGYIRSKNGFCIGAAAYLEGHVNSRRLKDDLIHLKEKVDAGADFLITQLFFDNRLYYDFMDKAQAVGIGCPVVPGIMPILKADQIKSLTAKSGCSIPAKLVLMMDKYQNDPADLRKAGMEYAALQIRDLLDNGVPGIHLYTMNKPEATENILSTAGLLEDGRLNQRREPV